MKTFKTKAKTCLGFYRQLPPDIRKRAIRNYHKFCLAIDTPILNLSDAICFGFSWTSTPEGYHYWLQIAARCSQLPRPELPDPPQ